MGKSDRALVVGALGLAGGLAPRSVDFWPALLWAASALAIVTCWNRVAAALREAPAPSRGAGGR